jgi:Family of unknown function (DUF6159)
VIVSLRSSWALAKASWAILRADRELLLFPFLAFLGLVAVFIAFLIPTVSLALNGSLLSPDGKTLSPLVYVGLFLFYVVAYTVVFFFNTGLVGAAMIRLNGGDPTVRDGFRVAVSHLPAIVGWAVIAATVGMILRALSSRSTPLGRGLALVLGVTWSVLTFLVVPIIVAENVGPIAAIRRSRALISRTWGQTLIGGASISAIFGILAVLIAFAGFWLATVPLKGSGTTLQAIVVGVALLAAGAIGLIGAALSGIYHASLYRYATTGNSGEGAFAQSAMSQAFESRYQQSDRMPTPGIHFGGLPSHNVGFRPPVEQPAADAPATGQGLAQESGEGK